MKQLALQSSYMSLGPLPELEIHSSLIFRDSWKAVIEKLRPWSGH
jgi:hypothetical protein